MKKKSLFLIWTIALMVASCKPLLYETKYKFVPPKTQSERLCINTCIRDKDGCINTCQLSASQLEMTDNFISAFSDSPYYSSHNKPMKDCENRCNESFRQCYANCGGQIIEKAECVAFCDTEENEYK